MQQCSVLVKDLKLRKSVSMFENFNLNMQFRHVDVVCLSESLPTTPTTPETRALPPVPTTLNPQIIRLRQPPVRRSRTNVQHSRLAQSFADDDGMTVDWLPFLNVHVSWTERKFTVDLGYRA